MDLITRTVLVLMRFTGVLLLCWGAADAADLLYVSTNAPTGNSVSVLRRSAAGAFETLGSYPTGGFGTGGGLESQAPLARSSDGTLLFCVNAASHSVTVFRLAGTALEHAGTYASNGERPVSVAEQGGTLYVLNEGGTGNVAGFRVGLSGALTPLSPATVPLSRAGSGGAQVAFHPRLPLLVVTERLTDRVLAYRLDGAGSVISGPHLNPAPGRFPFGFAFTPRGQMVLSEAFGGRNGTSAVSTLVLRRTGRARTLFPSAPTHQIAACWVALTADGRFAYTTNTPSGSISGFRLSARGGLRALNAGGVTASSGPGSAPTELAMNAASTVLYAIHAGTRQVGAYAVGTDGALTAAGTVSVPPHAVGLVTREE